jgi:hypothetical protein
VLEVDLSAAVSEEVAGLPGGAYQAVSIPGACDAKFPLSKAAEALDKSERKEVTRAALIPGR